MYLVSAKINTRLSSRTRIKSRGSVIGCVHTVVIHTWMLNIFLSGRCVIEWTTRNLNGIVHTWMKKCLTPRLITSLLLQVFVSELYGPVVWEMWFCLSYLPYYYRLYVYIKLLFLCGLGVNLLQNCKNTEHKKTAPHSKIFVQFLCTLLLWNARWVK